jgi:Nucleotidyl transferase AbiEii toxin, Type IV TA system
MTNTMEYASNFRPSWLEREFPMLVDIGFGDAVYSEPELASFPVLLPVEPPLIRAYPREATMAEKFHAMVVLDIRNSRMKDFYDIWFMANTWEFEMESLQKAIEFSFKRRGTSVPEDIPFALTDGFLDDPQKKTQLSKNWGTLRRFRGFPRRGVIASGYCFKSAVQFVISVSGSVMDCGETVFITNFLPSAETVYGP